jgi:DNA-binding protein HU-beta
MSNILALSAKPFKERYADTKTLGRKDLAREVAAKLGLTLDQADRAITAFLESMTEAWTNGKRVEIRGLANFSPHHRGVRKAYIPPTNSYSDVPARWTVKFKISKLVQQMLDETLGK